MREKERSGPPNVKTKILHQVWCARWRGNLYLERRKKFFPNGVGKEKLIWL